MPHPKVKLSDNSGNTVGVTSNRLDVNVAGATMSTGDIEVNSEFPAAATIADDFANPDTTSVMSMLMGYDTTGTNWNRLHTNTGAVGTGTLRVTIATDDNVSTKLTGIDADTGAIKASVATAAPNTTNLVTVIQTEDAAHVSADIGYMFLGVRNDTLASLVSDDGDYAPLQVNASGALYVDGSGVTQPVSGTVTANLSATDNAVLDAMVVDLAAIEALLITIDADTNSTQGYLSNLSGTQYQDDANWTDGSSKHLLVGGLYQSSMQSVTDGDVAPFQVDANGVLKVSPSTGSEFQVDIVSAPTIIVNNSNPTNLAALVTQVSTARTVTGDVGHNITGMLSDNNEGVDSSTAEVLKSSTACKRVDMQADSANTGYIYVGGSDLSAVKGIRLAPGDFYSIDVDNTADIYVLASVDEEDIHFTYYT